MNSANKQLTRRKLFIENNRVMHTLVVFSLVPRPLVQIMMCHPPKMLSHCCTPMQKRQSTHSPPQPDRIQSPRVPPDRQVVHPLRVATGDTGWNRAFQRPMTQIQQKAGALHADTSLGGEGWCWGGEEIPPPASDTRTVTAPWVLQRRHLLVVWRTAPERPKRQCKQINTCLCFLDSWPQCGVVSV